MNTIFVVFQGWISVMRAGLSAVLIFYGLSFMFTSASQAAGSDESSAINAAIDRYVNDVQSAAPEAIRPPGYQNFLLTQATLTQNFVDKGKPCLAEDVLQRLRRDLARSLATNDQNDTSQLASSLAVDLLADVLNVESQLLSSPGTSACGGGATPTSPAPSPVATITSSDNHEVTFHVAFPPARFVPLQGNGQQFLRLMMSGMGNGGEPAIGTPELPMTGETVAVPQGASVSVQVLGTSGYQLPAVQLWPVQPEPPATVTSDLGPLPPGPAPFTINEAAYA